MSDNKMPRTKYVLGSTPGKLVRFSYFNVFEPRVNTQNGKMEKSMVVLIPKTNTEDISAIKRVIEAQKREVWLDAGKKLPPEFHNPLRDGDTALKNTGESYGAEVAGHYFMSAKTGADKPVQVVGTTKDANGKFVRIGATDIKSGDWGRVSVNLGAYVKGKGGVGCYLNTVQLVRIGEPLGNAASAEDDFGEFADEEHDPLLD